MVVSGYDGPVVDQALLERLQRLDAPALMEVRDEIDRLIGDEDVPAEVLAIVDARLAAKGPGPDPDVIPAEEFLRRVRARRSA
jgi:hypothetical protein